MKLPHKTLERKLFQNGYKYIIAVDEVGMAPLAGPVTVCAVLFTRKFFQKRNKNLYYLRDSKQLLSHQREKYVLELLKLESKDFKFKIAYSKPATIDKINIYQAARLAMRRAIKNLVANTMTPIILVDGKTKIKGLDIEQIPIVKGDRKIFSIACASVLAKVYRDNMMRRYAKIFPQYGFDKHKGYCTKHHQEIIKKHGICPIHRKSFAPVRKFI